MIEEPDWSNMTMMSAVSPKFLQLFASVIMTQSTIELELQMCIAKLLKLDFDRAQILTSELSYRQLIGLISSSMQKHTNPEGDLFKEFKYILGKLDEFENFRNNLAHSIWSHSKDGIHKTGAHRMKITSKRKAGLKVLKEDVTEEDLELYWKKGRFYIEELKQRVDSAIA